MYFRSSSLPLSFCHKKGILWKRRVSLAEEGAKGVKENADGTVHGESAIAKKERLHAGTRRGEGT
jgi:hypothetical protein